MATLQALSMDSRGQSPSAEDGSVIIGAGGHGSEVRAYIGDVASSRHVRLLGFVDENRTPGPWLGTEVLGGLSALQTLAHRQENDTLGYITAVGDNGVRLRLVKTIEGLGLRNLRPLTLR